MNSTHIPSPCCTSKLILSDPDDPDIVMAFGPVSCVKTVGAGGRHDGVLSPADKALLEAQLNDNTVSSGSFILKVDKVAETGHILVSYEDEGLNWTINFERESPVDLISSDGTQDVFEFTGTIEVLADGWGGAKGKRGRRAIACGGDNSVTATVTRASA